MFSGVSWPNALGTETIPRVRADALRDVLLLPSSALVHHTHPQASFRSRAGACARQFRALRLRLCRHARARSPAAQRAAATHSRRRLKSLKQGVSRRLIAEAEHFWQKRYYDFNVRNESQFVEKLRYIHRNPVKRGLCVAAKDWAWSSFRQYATGCAGTVEIECEWTARERERAAGRLCPAVKLPHSSQKTA